MKGKSFLRSLFPVPFYILFKIRRAWRSIIVYDLLIGLPISFAWRKDYCTCILQHRYEVGNDNGLRE